MTPENLHQNQPGLTILDYINTSLNYYTFLHISPSVFVFTCFGFLGNKTTNKILCYCLITQGAKASNVNACVLALLPL